MSARTVQDCENAVPALIFGAAATVTEGGADLLEPAVSSAVDDAGSLLHRLLSPNIVAHASSDAAEELPDDASVVRGGTNTADRFANASGVRTDEDGNIFDVSVTSAPGRSIEELSRGIPNKQIGVTTVGGIRGAGGTIELDPTPNNPYHCLIG